MNTTQLECFIHVARSLNFLAASEQLNMSQPAVSKQIQSLESELNVKLFNRTTRNVSLTGIGQQFLQDAENILKSVHDAKQKINNFGRNANYSIRIGYSEAGELPWLSDVLTSLLSRYTNIHPEFSINPIHSNLNLLEQGSLDAVIAINDNLKTEKYIDFYPIGPIRLCCLVSKKHPLHIKTSVSFRELSDYAQIIFFPYSVMRNIATEKDVVRPVNTSQPLYVCNSISEAYALVKIGLGYSLIPDFLTLASEEYSFLELPEGETKQFGIYYNVEKQFSALKEFCRIAKETYPISESAPYKLPFRQSY